VKTFSSYTPSLDMAAVAAAVDTVEGRELSVFEREDALELIWVAAERWFARDMQDLEILGLEEEVFVRDLPDQRTEWHGFVDGKAVVTADAGEPFNGKNQLKRNFAGDTLLWDWKTTDGSVDWAWEQKLKESWQWKEYAFATGASLFSYRGLSRREKDSRECLILVPETNGVEVKEFLTGVFSYRQSLVDSGIKVWTRHAPFACKAYGRECPFLDDCKTYSMEPVAPGDRQLSYSSINDLLLCPERHRRKSLSEEREQTDSTIFGQAVHRGLEELWRQGKELQR
jgi:hypothetical protein